MKIDRQLWKKGFRYLTDPDYRFVIKAKTGKYDSMPDEEYLKHYYKGVMGKKLDLDNPKTFNEKLQWLKLYNRRPEYTMMVDKYKVREYIKEKLGEEYLIPLLGVWDDPDEIDFDALPEQFVLKCNHNSGTGMCICTDKSQLDIEKVKDDLRKGLNENYYLSGREWPYKDVPRKIICEKYMVDESGYELKDYKVLCFNGKPKLIEIHRNRFQNHTQDIYDTNWRLTEYKQVDSPMEGKEIETPCFGSEMLKLSGILSSNIPHVRVDWYYVKGQLYFGELTFFDASGFEGFIGHQDEEIGSWLVLPQKDGKSDF